VLYLIVVSATTTQSTLRTEAPFQISPDGGAVYLSSISSTKTTTYTYSILSSNFTGNLADESGGAIDSYEVPGTVGINNCSFYANRASLGYAAAAYVYGGIARTTSVFLRNSVFVSNSHGLSSVYLKSCGCVGTFNSTFANSTTTALTLMDIGGDCENQFGGSNYGENVLFQRFTIAQSSSDNTNITNYIGSDVSHVLCVDIRYSTFVNITTEPSLAISSGNFVALVARCLRTIRAVRHSFRQAVVA